MSQRGGRGTNTRSQSHSRLGDRPGDRDDDGTRDDDDDDADQHTVAPPPPPPASRADDIATLRADMTCHGSQ